MVIEALSLARQVDMVFRQLQEELSYLSSGTIFLQIRNNLIGKFGIKHLPMEGKDGQLEPSDRTGLSPIHQKSFRQMALEALQHKKGWTHGEIWLDFHVKQGCLRASIQFESNYNMANLLNRNS